MIDEIDYAKLNNMTSFLKQESESTAEFTIEFIECLMKRYNLNTALFEGLEIEEVPDEIINTLREGKIPTKEELLPLNSEAQNILLMELIWFCGIQRIALFSDDEELEEGMPSTFESIIAMRDVSNAHVIGSYLISALTLLMGKIPSTEIMDLLTNNFEDSQQNLQRISTVFLEVCSSILCHYNEDSYYYTLNTDEDDDE